MTALTAENPITGLTPSRFNSFPVAAATTIFQGAMVVLNYLGQLIPAASLLQGHMRVIGVSQGRAAPGSNVLDGTNNAVAVSAGDYNAIIEAQGVFNFVNGSASNGGAATDTIVAADIGGYAYAIDDATVSRDSLNSNRPCVGIIRCINDDGSIAVFISGDRWAPNVTLYEGKADGDLSALRNSQVKIDDASGVGRIDSGATDTTRTVGILINAPDAAGKKALVVMGGPAPCVVGAGGITAGDKVAATTAGASVAAGAAKTFVGHALETGTSAQTKMVYVQPGVMPA